MHRTLSVSVVIALLLMMPTACSDDATPDATDTTSEVSSEEVEGTPAADAPLEGAWRADITEDAYAAAIVAAGYSEDIAAHGAELVPGPEFRLEFLGDRFRMSYVPEDEQWQSGTVSIRGDQVTIDDEAPVGTATFRFTVDGDQLTFSDPSMSNPEIEAAPGVPDFLPAIGFWTAATWTRE